MLVMVANMIQDALAVTYKINLRNSYEAQINSVC